MGRPCVTVDVEDFHDGMRELGCPLPGGQGIRLGDLLETMARVPHDFGRLTFFVVGKFAPACARDLSDLAGAGHEIASHGFDHGRLPEDPGALEDWLRRGKNALEDIVGEPVVGFRPPRFDIPETLGLDGFREVIGRAGFNYVSSEWSGAPDSGVVDLPVSRAFGIRLGGGSYQRLLPRPLVPPLLRRCPSPAVLYYHSYDFSPDTLPSTWSARSMLEVRELVLRRRIPRVFLDVLSELGSRTCREVVRELRSVL